MHGINVWTILIFFFKSHDYYYQIVIQEVCNEFTINKWWSKKFVMGLPNLFIYMLLISLKSFSWFFLLFPKIGIIVKPYMHTHLSPTTSFITNGLFLKITRFLSSIISLFLIVSQSFICFTFLHMLVLFQNFHLKIPFKGFTSCMHKNTKFKLKIKIHFNFFPK
jgi:hypothetical protein